MRSLVLFILALACALPAQATRPASRSATLPTEPHKRPTLPPPRDAVRPLDGKNVEELLKTYSLERVITPEDIEDASVSFTHFADEQDAMDHDYYEVTAKGIVLGIQDSSYVVFTTRCAADFSWPNHDIRWRDMHGWEDGGPEFCNEGFIFHASSFPARGDEYYASCTTNLTALPPDPRDGEKRKLRRDTLALAREAGDLIVSVR